MRFLTDENVSKSTVSFLRLQNHDVKDVKEEGWFGYDDEKIAKIAKRQRRIILTF